LSAEEILSLWFVKVALIWPVAEELIFRGVIQGWLMERNKVQGSGFKGSEVGPSALQRQGDRASVLTRANLITSVLFAAAHLVYHSGLHAALVFFPSLVFGHFRERSGGVWAPIALHVAYNACWFFVMSNE
jgi:membrane protease YdiL (CAAX protease family)